MLGELVDSSLRKMGDAIDFNVLDILPLIGPPRMKRKMARIHAEFHDDGCDNAEAHPRARDGRAAGRRAICSTG